jgi:hypothetical protein
MKRKLFITLTALMWSALPLDALAYRQVWNRLPARLATHFAASGQPKGWMPRELSLCFALGLTAFTLIVFTGIAFLLLQHKAVPDPPSFALLGSFYLIQVRGFAGRETPAPVSGATRLSTSPRRKAKSFLDTTIRRASWT